MSLPRDPARQVPVVALVAIILFAAVAFAFGPAWSAPYIFDDGPSIRNNSTIRELWPPSIALTPPGRGSAVSGRPIVNYSLAITYAINRTLGIVPESPAATRAYHITNMMLHWAAAVLLFCIVSTTMRVGRIPETWRRSASTIAFAVAVLWVLHPLQTEAVDYLSQRTELLVSVFYLGSLYCSLRAWMALNTRPWTIAAIICCALGMGSKEVMITAPLVIVLFDRAMLFDRWLPRARRPLYAGLFATMLISIALIVNGARSATVGFHAGITWYQYLYSQGWAIAHYLRLALWPGALVVDYGRSPVHGARGIPGLVGLSALFAFMLWAWRQSRLQWLAFVCAWFFLLLAPSSSVVPIVTEIAAERRMYLALAALILVGVVGAEYVRRRFTRLSPVVIATGAILVVSMTGATRARSRMYNDPESLWRDAVQKRPDNPRAFEGLAVVILNKDTLRLGEADTLFARAALLDPAATTPLVSRAAIAIKQKRMADAEVLLRHALQLAPDDSAANHALGQVLSASAHPDDAIPYLRRVAVTAPSAQTLATLGTAYLVAGQLDSAVAVLGRATQLDGDDANANRYLGAALIEVGRGSDAISPLSHAAQKDPGSGFTLALLAVAYAEAHQVELAMQTARRAVSRSPADPQAWAFAGRAAQYAGRYPDAISYLEHAARLDSADVQAPTRLGFLLASTGRVAEGIHLLERVIARAPDYEPAQIAMARFTRNTDRAQTRATAR